MKKVIRLFLILFCISLSATAKGEKEDSLMMRHIILPNVRLNVKAPEPVAVPLDQLNPDAPYHWWVNRIKYKNFDFKDSTINYPKFIQFCVDVYNWGDEFFNGTDQEYVVGTGKRWKARVVNDNWVDSYSLKLPNDLKMQMLSNIYANIGAYLQYMAVSIGYSYDMSTIFGSDPMEHKKWEFGFNCARFNIELYRQENNGGTYLRKFGHMLHNTDKRVFFPGLRLRTQGADAIYFFNHRRYSHGAAYNFSKFQKKNQGSFIAGFSHTNVNLDIDFAQLPSQFLPHLTVPALNYRYHYNSYSLVLGYGFNWVLTPRLLYNITVTPSIGASHCFADSLEGEKWMVSMNLAGRTSLTYNLGNWFLCVMGKMNGHWYKSGTYSLFNSIEYFSANIGIRF